MQGFSAHRMWPAMGRQFFRIGLLMLFLLSACRDTAPSSIGVQGDGLLDASTSDVSPLEQDASQPVGDFGISDQGHDQNLSYMDAAMTLDIGSPTGEDSGVDSGLSVDAHLPQDAFMTDMADAATTSATRAEQIVELMDGFGLSAMRLRLPEDEIAYQSSEHVGTVDFISALTAGIESFLNDGSDVESPRSLAADVREGPCLDDDLRERVRCFLNRDTALLELYGSEGFAPEEGESVSQYWIFILRAESLSDHIQWAIVDRNGVEPTYNYGFN